MSPLPWSLGVWGRKRHISIYIYICGFHPSGDFSMLGVFKVVFIGQLVLHQSPTWKVPFLLSLLDVLVDSLSPNTLVHWFLQKCHSTLDCHHWYTNLFAPSEKPQKRYQTRILTWNLRITPKWKGTSSEPNTSSFVFKIFHNFPGCTKKPFEIGSFSTVAGVVEWEPNVEAQIPSLRCEMQW